MGRTIHKIINVQRNTDEAYRAEKVMFVIITDGYENASREYTADKVRALIRQQTDKYGWEFIFLGANIDAVETARHYGISPDRAQNYHADSSGIVLNFRVMGSNHKNTVTPMRCLKTGRMKLIGIIRDGAKKGAVAKLVNLVRQQLFLSQRLLFIPHRPS